MARIHSFNIGTIEAFVLEENHFETSIGNVFLRQDYPIPSLLDGQFKAEENCEVGFNYLGLKIQGKLILIDSGRGTAALVAGLEKLGYSAENVDYILITHGDGDHVGGLGNFKNATVVMPQKAYDLWLNQESFEQLLTEFKSAPFMANAPEERISMALLARKKYRDFLKNISQEKLILLNDDEWFLKSLKFVYAPGHRSDHFAVEIRTAKKNLLHYSDAVRHLIQLVPPFIPSKYDAYPTQFSETLQTLQAYAKLKNAIEFCTHYKFPGFLN